MADTLRIRSTLPLAINASEPLADKFVDKPGLAPQLRAIVIKPGINEFVGDDAEVYRKWAVANPTFSDSVSEAEGDGPDDEYGFEPALQRATEGDNANLASEGSTVKEPGPTPADVMSPKSGAAAPVPSSTAPLAPSIAAAPIAPVAPLGTAVPVGKK